MVERLLILKTTNFNNEIDENHRMTKSQSFNTDDDESLSPENLQHDEDDSLKTSKSDNNLLKPDEQKRSLLLLNSPSIDSINDPEGSISDNITPEKPKKKKRRPINKQDSLDLRQSYIKKRPWYTKIDYTKPIIYVTLLFLIYLMWVKRDVWIPRLLTSNTRFRRTEIAIEEKLNEKGDLSSTKNSSSLSSNQDDIINDNDNKINNINKDQKLVEDNDEDSPTTSNKSPSQKLNLRTRRNKISFTRERRTRKHHSRNKIIDDDDDDDNDDDDDDDVDNNNDEIIIKPNKVKEPILPSSIHSSKNHHHHRHHRSDQSHEQKTKSPTSSKTNLILRPHDDIVEQLRTLVKSHGRHRDLLTTLKKETGLSKTKINRFIYGKDFRIITLDILISFLKSFDSTLLIVPK